MLFKHIKDGIFELKLATDFTVHAILKYVEPRPTQAVYGENLYPGIKVYIILPAHNNRVHPSLLDNSIRIFDQPLDLSWGGSLEADEELLELVKDTRLSMIMRRYQLRYEAKYFYSKYIEDAENSALFLLEEAAGHLVRSANDRRAAIVKAHSRAGKYVKLPDLC